MELFIIISRIVGQRKAAEDGNASGRPSKGAADGRSFSSLHTLFWRAVHWCFLATSFIRLAFSVLMTSRSLPPRAFRSTAPRKGGHGTHHEVERRDAEPSKTPVLAFRCWSAISNLIEMDTRMPWLCGAISMLQWASMTGPGQIAAVDGRLDRWVTHLTSPFSTPLHISSSHCMKRKSLDLRLCRSWHESRTVFRGFASATRQVKPKESSSRRKRRVVRFSWVTVGLQRAQKFPANTQP